MTDKSKTPTLSTPQSTKPFQQRVPAKNPFFGQLPKFQKPQFSGPKFTTAHLTQNRGGK